jgi:hypothetical protein
MPMPFKTILVALALSLAPALALAEGCHHATMQQEAASCAEGAVWDVEKGQCVLQPSS